MIHDLEIYFLIFISYAFIGWCMEVICKLFQYKRFINRGFLIGPYCPIYGCGAVLITLLLKNFTYSPVILFLLCILICSILEYMTSYVMEKIFHARWWDYSTKKFNINGRICLNTMIPFGMLGLLMMYVINPFIINFFNSFDNNTLSIIVISVLLIFLTDSFVSVHILSKVRHDTKILDKDNTEEMSNIVKEKLRSYNWTYRRLLNAYPNFKYIGIVIKKTIEKEEEIIKKTNKKIKKKITDKLQ